MAGAQALSQFLRQAAQSCLQFSCLCGRAVLAASEPARFISHAQGHDLAEFSSLLPFTLLPVLPEISITQSWN